MAGAGLLRLRSPGGQGGDGKFGAATWTLSARGRTIKGVPILTVDGTAGRITGIRMAEKQF